MRAFLELDRRQVMIQVLLIIMELVGDGEIRHIDQRTEWGVTKEGRVERSGGDGQKAEAEEEGGGGKKKKKKRIAVLERGLASCLLLSSNFSAFLRHTLSSVTGEGMSGEHRGRKREEEQRRGQGKKVQPHFSSASMNPFLSLAPCRNSAECF